MVATALFLPPSLMAVNTIIHNAIYDFSNLTTSTDTLGGVTYATVSYGDLFNGGAPGAPALPIDYIRFSVPWNATGFTVSATLRNNTMDNINRLVYPCQTPRMMNYTTPVTITLPDSAIYYANTFYPQQNAWVVDEGFLGGENHIVTVAVMPVSYKHSGTGNLASDMLKKSQTVRLTLSYQLSDSLPMYPIVRQDSTLRQEGYALTRTMVVNPSSVEEFAPIEMPIDSLLIINPGSGDGTNGGRTPHIDPNDPPVTNDSSFNVGGELQIEKFPYLIITTDEFAHSVRRIAALKNQKGYHVKIVTMDEVLASPQNMGGDWVHREDGSYQLVDSTDAGKLRQFLKYYYRLFGTEYVLLAGNDIPFIIKHEAPTDWYYSDLNGDFTKEFDLSVKDSCDFYAELNVGRLLAKTTDQIDNYTDKAQRYELNPGHGDYAFLNNAIVTQGQGLEIFNIFYNLVTLHLPKIFSNVSLLKEQDNQNFPTGKNIIDSININKYGFMCSLNHGSPYGINVYGHDGGDITAMHYLWAIDSIRNMYDVETGNGLNNIHNKHYPMIYYSLSCKTMPFGYNESTSFGESFTMGKDYGGPVYIGYTTEVINGFAFESFQEFLNHIPETNYNLGKAFSLSKKGYKGTLLTRGTKDVLSQNYLGDPSIELWSDEPQLYSNIIVSRGDSTITLSGIDADSTIVAVFNNNLNYPIKRMVTSSSVSFNRISPNSTIMLYKHNYIPYIVPMSLQNVILNRSQYVIATDITAGNSVDSNRTAGDVTVKNGVEYEIEASGTVTLQGGFNVEKGATFAVYPSSF